MKAAEILGFSSRGCETGRSGGYGECDRDRLPSCHALPHARQDTCRTRARYQTSRRLYNWEHYENQPACLAGHTGVACVQRLRGKRLLGISDRDRRLSQAGSPKGWFGARARRLRSTDFNHSVRGIDQTGQRCYLPSNRGPRRDIVAAECSCTCISRSAFTSLGRSLSV